MQRCPPTVVCRTLILVGSSLNQETNDVEMPFPQLQDAMLFARFPYMADLGWPQPLQESG